MPNPFSTQDAPRLLTDTGFLPIKKRKKKASFETTSTFFPENKILVSSNPNPKTKRFYSI